MPTNFVKLEVMMMMSRFLAVEKDVPLIMAFRPLEHWTVASALQI